MVTEKRIVFLLVCGLFVLVAACGPTGPANTPTVPAQVSPEARPPGGPLVPGADVVIVYRREGGFTAMTEVFAIRRDGSVEVQSSLDGTRTWHVAPDDVMQLLAALERADFFSLRDSYLPDVTCCDRMIHTITYHRDGETHSVVTIDANPDEPPALRDAMDALNQFLGRLN